MAGFVDSMKIIREALGSDFTRKIAGTFGTRMLLALIGLVTTVVVARLLGPEGRGLYAVALTVGAIGVQFGNLGLHSSNTYFVAKDRSLLSQLAGNALVVGLGLGSLGALAAWVIFQFWPGLAPVDGGLLVLALAWIPFGLTYLLQQNLLIGIHRIRDYNVIDIIVNAAGLAGIALLMVWKQVLPVYVLCVGLLSMGLGVLLAHNRITGALESPLSVSLKVFRSGLGYGLKIYVSCVLVYLLTRSNLVIVQYLLGAEYAGQFSVATALADLVYMLPVVVGIILFPKLSAMGDDGDKYRFSVRTAGVLGAGMSLIAAAVWVFAAPLMSLLFGVAYMPAVPSFVWILPGIVALSVNSVYMNYFASVGMPAITIYSPAVAVLVNIVCATYLIPLTGIEGAAVASSISYGVMLVFSLVYCHILQKRGR